jgi:hypothetical protein
MRKIITSAAAAAAAVALLGGTGIAAASSHAAAVKTETFQLMSTSTTSNKSSMIAYGAFTAAGVDVSGAHNTDTITFPNGTLTLVHKKTGLKQHFDPTTCLFTGTETATYTLGNGTGAYKGVTGSGKATANLLGIAARNSAGKCSMAKAPLAFHTVINGSGPITVP